MKRTIAVILSLVLSLAAAAQNDARLTAILDDFVATLQTRGLDEKAVECDRMIASCSDSTVRQKVTVGLFERYRDSALMGDEAVAIHIYDSWIETGKVKMKGEFERLNAGLFADVNRSTLLGEDAPKIILENPAAKKVRIPLKGRSSVVFFYNTDCSKCKAVEAMLPKVLSDVDFDMDVYCIYVGTDRKEWDSFRKGRFQFTNRNLRIFHLWDPKTESGFEKLWGVISTPKLYMVDAMGTVIGRRLEPESIVQLLPLARTIQIEYEKSQMAMKAEEYTVISDVTKDGVRHITAKPSSLVCSRQIDFDIKGGRLYNVVYTGGCPGNLIAVGRLVEGKKVDDVVKLLDGVDCGGRGTSCTDQLVRILKSLK